jgi:hypothetical protein
MISSELSIVVTGIPDCCEIAFVYVPRVRINCAANTIADSVFGSLAVASQFSQKLIGRDVRETFTNVTVSKANDFATFRFDFLDRSSHLP